MGDTADIRIKIPKDLKSEFEKYCPDLNVRGHLIKWMREQVSIEKERTPIRRQG